jgi:hypothetical protein
MKGCAFEPETEIWNHVEMENPAGRVLKMVHGRRMPIISPEVDPKTLVGKS